MEQSPSTRWPSLGLADSRPRARISSRARLSPHLGSRGEVGDILLGSGVPTAVLQAAVIIGSGSASFEMLRYLTERLPVMVTCDGNGRTIYTQRAIFQPPGLAGHVYWHLIAPFHGVVFGGMVRNITAAARNSEPAGVTPSLRFR